MLLFAKDAREKTIKQHEKLKKQEFKYVINRIERAISNGNFNTKANIDYSLNEEEIEEFAEAIKKKGYTVRVYDHEMLISW